MNISFHFKKDRLFHAILLAMTLKKSHLQIFLKNEKHLKSVFHLVFWAALELTYDNHV